MKSFHNCIFYRVVLRQSEAPAANFLSKKEILQDFREVIAEHRNLWRAGILQRAVSMGNILIEHSYSSKGYCGFMIDFDLATPSLHRPSYWGNGLQTGTRVFQSINTLRSYHAEQGRFSLHDHLDYMESIYYVLCWLCIGYSAPGIKVDPFPPVLLDWECANPVAAANAKEVPSLRAAAFDEMVTDYFGLVFCHLLEKLHAFFRPHVERKGGKAPINGWPSLEELQPQAERDYEIVLNIFDEAIAEYEEEIKENTWATSGGPKTPTASAMYNQSLRLPLSPKFPPQSVHHNLLNSSPLRPAFLSSAPFSPTHKRKSDSDDDRRPKPKKTRRAYKASPSTPKSPTTSNKASKPTRTSNLKFSESYGDV